MSPPSRRTVLRSSGLALAGGLAGCFGSPSAGTPDGTASPTTAAPTTEPTPPDGDGPDASLAARNEVDGSVAVRVELRSEGQVVHEETVELSAGVTSLLSRDLPAGEYVVEASLGDDASVSHQWSVDADYAGQLTVVVTEAGELTVREQLSGSPCSTDALPYAAPGQPETFSPGSLDLDNESGEAATVSLELAHGGETFYECTFDLAVYQNLRIGQLTRTAGTYTVTVDVAEGGRTVYDWRVPEGYHWPQLTVIVPERGDPLVGCGAGGEVPVAVENPTDAAQSATLRLGRDGETVAEETVEVAATATVDVELSTPIGAFYTLTVSTAAGEARTEIVECYCYEATQTTATLPASGPTVETSTLVCE